MPSKNKYTYLAIVQGHYGFGWEDVSADEKYHLAYADLMAYRENEPQYPHRIIERRELNDS